MQLPISTPGKFSKAYTLQRLIQLAYSFLFLGSHLKATWIFFFSLLFFAKHTNDKISAIRNRNVCLSLPQNAEGPLPRSLLHSGWNREHFAAELHFPRHRLKSCNLPPQWSKTPFGMFVWGFALAQSQAKHLFWILNMEKQDCEFFPELLQQHV